MDDLGINQRKRELARETDSGLIDLFVISQLIDVLRV
jgi:hypothetical protein